MSCWSHAAATNKPSTSAAARRPPIATPSAAQAAGAGRAPRKVDLACSSLSTALRGRQPQHQHHLSTKKNSAKKNRRRRPAGGASGSVGSRVAPLPGFPRKRIRWVGAPLTREVSARVWLICPTKLLIVQCRVFGDDPVAESRGAAGSRSSNISISDVGECRVGRTLLPPTNHRRRPPRGDRPLPHPAPHRRLAQVAHPARSISHAHRCPRRCAAASRSISIIFPRKRIPRKRIGDGGQQAAPAGRSDRGSLRCPDFHEKEFAGSARPSRARFRRECG